MVPDSVRTPAARLLLVLEQPGVARDLGQRQTLRGVLPQELWVVAKGRHLSQGTTDGACERETAGRTRTMRSLASGEIPLDTAVGSGKWRSTLAIRR